MKDNKFECSDKSNKIESILVSPIVGYQSYSQPHLILTGIIQNIQSGLTQLIDSKQKVGCLQKVDSTSDMEILMKIKKDVTTLQNLIKHNIEETSLYLHSIEQIQNKKMKNEKTNHTKSPESYNPQLRQSKQIVISSLHSQNIKEKLILTNHLQSNKENNFLLNNLEAACFDTNQRIEHKCHLQQDNKNKNILREITPFEIPPEYIETIKHTGQPEEDQQFDFAFYQDNEQINRQEADRDEKQKELSSVLKGNLNSCQAFASKNHQNPNITFYPYQTLVQDKINKKQKFVSDRSLFYFINHHPVLPQRLTRRRYTYLQKMTQKS